MNDKKHQDTIEALKAENEQLKHKLKILEMQLTCANKKCACYRNNQKMCGNIKK